MKTVTRMLLSKYGILSTNMISALTSDREEDIEDAVDREIANEANQEIIDVTPQVNPDREENKQAAAASGGQRF